MKEQYTQMILSELKKCDDLSLMDLILKLLVKSRKTEGGETNE